MHTFLNDLFLTFRSTAFAKSFTKTITTLDSSKQRIIDNNYHYGMSDMDAKQIKLMYKCDGGFQTRKLFHSLVFLYFMSLLQDLAL